MCFRCDGIELEGRELSGPTLLVRRLSTTKEEAVLGSTGAAKVGFVLRQNAQTCIKTPILIQVDYDVGK